MVSDLLQFLAKVQNPAPNIPPIDLKLSLSRSAKPDTTYTSRTTTAAASLPRQVGPCSRQSRQTIFILRKLNLKRPLPGVRVLREDVENQRRAVHDSKIVAEDPLKFSLVARRELLVE